MVNWIVVFVFTIWSYKVIIRSTYSKGSSPKNTNVDFWLLSMNCSLDLSLKSFITWLLLYLHHKQSDTSDEHRLISTSNTQLPWWWHAHCEMSACSINYDDVIDAPLFAPWIFDQCRCLHSCFYWLIHPPTPYAPSQRRCVVLISFGDTYTCPPPCLQSLHEPADRIFSLSTSRPLLN